MAKRISRKELKRILRYDPQTGIFIWRIATAKIIKVGSRAGHHHKTHRYVVITYKKRRYYAHVLAWFYVLGRWPKKEIDHKDLDRGNNRWTNLRLAKHQENCCNGPMRKNNTSGYRGVFRRKNGVFHAMIQHNRKLRHLGLFDTALAAANAYDTAAREFHGRFATTNFGMA